jgi:hypothetical protein
MRKDPREPLKHPQEILAQRIHIYIQSELSRAGINLQKISINGNAITVTVDKKVWEIESNLRNHLEKREWFTVEFLTSG